MVRESAALRAATVREREGARGRTVFAPCSDSVRDHPGASFERGDLVQARTVAQSGSVFCFSCTLQHACYD